MQCYIQDLPEQEVTELLRWANSRRRQVLDAAPGHRDGYGKPVKATDFERLSGYHALRHSSISILAVEGKTWDQIAALVGHLERRTTRRYVHFTPKDNRETADSIPFEF